MMLMGTAVLVLPNHYKMQHVTSKEYVMLLIPAAAIEKCKQANKC